MRAFTRLVALLLLLVASCTPEIRPGQFSCDPEAIAACPPDWSCVSFGPGFACTPWRATEAHCGNGQLDPGEECDWATASDFNCSDFPNRWGEGYCDFSCHYQCEHHCGDGILQGAEQCDDNNNVSDDGCTAQCQSEPLVWKQLHPANMPPARSEHGMAYDKHRELVVLFGGNGGTDMHPEALGDTWVFDGSSWEQRLFAPGEAPMPRLGHAMAYDEERQVTILLGGWAGSAGYLGDVWEFDGDTWTEISFTAPSGWRLAMAGVAGGGVLVFGGSSTTCCGSLLNDTWLYDGSSWELWEPQFGSMRPWVRWLHALAAGPDFVLLQSGRNLFGTVDWTTFADTWIWENGRWRTIPSQSRSPARYGHAVVYFPAWKKFLLFGGAGPPSGWHFADSWLFDPKAESWDRSVSTSAPPARWLHRMVHDDRHGRILLFGGEGTTDGTAMPFGDLWMATASASP